jgi:hypothetical protein
MMIATPESLRTEADRNRHLAAQARRMAELMHQPAVKQQFMTQARQLDQAAAEFEKQAWQCAGPGASPNVIDDGSGLVRPVATGAGLR